MASTSLHLGGREKTPAGLALDYLNLPPTTQCPHTLVLDLDDTLFLVLTASRLAPRETTWREQFLIDMAMGYQSLFLNIRRGIPS